MQQLLYSPKNNGTDGRLFNILHTEWSPDGWGGQERRIIQECLRVREMGHHVMIACQPGSAMLEHAKRAELPVEEVVMRSCIDPKAVWNLYRLIKKHRINVVSTHSSKDSWSGGFAAKLAGVDLLVRTRHISFPISNSPFNIVYRMPDGIVTTGEVLRQALIAENGMAPEKLVSIATGVSLQRFDAGRPADLGLKRELGIPEGAPVVTMVAVIRSMKRYDLFVAAAAMLREEFPEARFLVVGDGSGRAGLEAQIKEAGLEERVIMAGYRSDIPAIYSISDLAVLTSDRSEGVPQSITQAMAMGLPVIASPVGGITEQVLDGKTGILAATGDAASFAHAIGKLLRDEPLRGELGKAAREHVLQRYTEEIMARRTLEFYSQLLSAKGK